MNKPPKTKPRRNLKASEIAARNLVHFIREEGLKQGDMLPREQLMQEQFGVGRGTLREALRLLEVQGLISIKPGVSGGPAVDQPQPDVLGRTLSLFFQMSSATYNDLAEALLILTPTIARRAAENPDRQNVESKLNSAVEESESVKSPARQAALATAGFHRTLTSLNGNPIITLLTSALEDLLREHMEAASPPAFLVEHCRKDHRQIADAIIAGDAESAAELSAWHMKDLLGYYREHFPRFFEQYVDWR